MGAAGCWDCCVVALLGVAVALVKQLAKTDGQAVGVC